MTRGEHSLLQISAEADTRLISYQIEGYFHLIRNVPDIICLIGGSIHGIGQY